MGTLSPIAWLKAYFQRVENRWKIGQPIITNATQDLRWYYSPIYIFRTAWYLVGYVVLGQSVSPPGDSGLFSGLTPADLLEISEDPQAWLQKELHRLGTSEEVKGFTEIVGTIVTEPVISLLESYAGAENPDPHEMARAFHGIASGLPWAASTVDNLLAIPFGDRAPKIGKSIDQLYWGLGLGFLGWQTLAPLLSSGLQPNLERYYNKLYRPTRFTPGQARDIFALGIWSADKMRSYLQEQGWRDDDIQTWLDISYRDLSEGVIWDLYERGLMSFNEVERRLRKAGYNPDDIPLLFRAHEKQDTTDAQKYLLSTAKAALKKNLMSQSEFREILTGLNYAPREIDLQITLITTQQVNEQKELTAGQIRELYENRVIGSSEVVANLTQVGYEASVANQLLQAWNNEALPKAARLNKSTITEAYVAGVLTRQAAKDLLAKEAGYSPENAEIILKIEEAQAKGTNILAPEGVAAVSLSLLTDFAQNGLITRPLAAARAELARFTPDDRERILSLMFATPVQSPLNLGPDALLDAYRRGVIDLTTLQSRLVALGLTANDANILIASLGENLSTSLVADAYVYGVIDRTELLARFRGAGLNDEDAEIFARTIELQNPEVFGEFATGFLKRASVGSLQLAFQRGMIDQTQFTDRLTSMGYNPDAVAVYLFNAEYQEPVNPKDLSKTDILSLYQNGQFTRSQALTRLQQIGYNIEDATLLVDQREVAIEDTDIGRAYLNGYIDQFGASSALSDEGWTFEEIDDFFTRADLGEI